MRIKVIFAIVLFFVVGNKLYAQKSQYQFSHLDIVDGLSSNQINCIFKDENGFMWFATSAGLNRFDGYKFRVIKHDANNPTSLNDNNVLNIDEGPDQNMWVYTHKGISIYNLTTATFSKDVAHSLLRYRVITDQLSSIKKDNEGNYWFLTNNKGIYCYHPADKTTDAFSVSAGSKIKLHSNTISAIAPAGGGRVWLIYDDGTLDQLNTHSRKLISRHYSLFKANHGKLQAYSAMMSKDSNIWICAVGSTMGVYCFDTKGNTLTHYSKDGPQNKLSSNVINTIIQAGDNTIWVGTDHGGINVINTDTHHIDYLLNKDDDSRSLRGDCVILYKDDAGIIWVGTFKQGISYFHKDIIQFPIIKHYLSNSASLPYEDVDCFVEDAGGNLWIGTNGGGLMYYNKTNGTFKRYRHDAADPNSLSNDVVISLFIDHHHQLWAGTYFGGLERLDGDRFVHYRHNDNLPGSISDDRVYSIMEDAGQNMWVGTFAGGLNIYHPQTNTFSHPKYNMLSEYTSILYEDRHKNIWIGRDKGIDIIQQDPKQVRHYVNQAGNPNSLIANDVNLVYEDRSGLFWIGTKEGISILNLQHNKFINIDDTKGLPNNNIMGILEDDDGRIWVSTKKGLASITLKKTSNTYSYQIRKYDEFDGLQAKEYNLKAALKTRNGDMIFGGAHGFNSFNPQKIHSFAVKPKIVFTDFQLFNKSVAVGDTIAGSVVLTKSILKTKSLVLNSRQNVFSLEFSACDYFNPNRIAYQYMLEGFDKGWMSASNDVRKATYTNLDAGDYVFKVRVSNTNNPGIENTAYLNIRILPPWWKSPFAFLVYVIMAICLLFYIRHRGILKIKRGFELMQEKMEAERKITKEREEARRMHELDLMKIKFFTNVSHEFRTPLSLIISPIDHLIRDNSNAGQQQQLMMIQRNGKRLLNLVNQLLDFRKMEFKELKLNLNKSDIICFIKETCDSFSDLAEQNHIDYLFDSEINVLITKFDQDKIERVLFNLLSNSFKFTDSGGHISVFVSFADGSAVADRQILEIKIIDTGIGIPVEKQEKIFERFFQDNLPEGLLNQGSGIGLSISREFIKMHDGDISVESEPGNGSCFTIRLPVSVENEQLVPSAPAPETIQVKSEDGLIGSIKKPVILLIEDNDDMRFYLKDNLKQAFHIVEAVNGKDGWQKALALHPNLIVSDVSMPEMNGIDLCNKIRHDERTAHIPVILLTAMVGDEDKLAGTASGANDYITKPFNFEILSSKITGLLQMQQTLKKTYQKQVDIQAQDIGIVSEDDKFLKKTLSCIETNITNPNFSVEELSRQMSLSRVSLYKRLLALTGKTPVDCIRTIRLKRAVQLLEKSKLSIANIAYEVGFNNPTYFSKVFKEEYGRLPSEYISEFRKKEKEAVRQAADV
jgi:signal transduction histidine kinase/ligand-binding sensor domain-containing protein/DNA-binding response OmpR family regulator